MQHYKKAFLSFAIERGVLKFGDFKLKSGRNSPYFFNAGLFNDGQALVKLGRFYAQAIIESGVEFDMLFGPAYKGIPLVAATAIALADQHGLNVPYCFNRKEAKTHGEAGTLVGAELSGKVLIVDDVITAGTAIRESMTIIGKSSASLAGVVVSLDRQERGQSEISAIQEVEDKYNTQVISIVSFINLLEFIADHNALASELSALSAYREKYGV